ncbi:hypothetical protein [Nitrosospira multiformis]|uniref:hypothetical protein n=1 Tax=Nitrosospira multiformis TaxID=1231 RepID=UPI001C42FF10|nr:hypothetical protein [Nitrosospira multiformis]
MKGKITEICGGRDAVLGCEGNRAERRNSTAGDCASHMGGASSIKTDLLLYDRAYREKRCPGVRNGRQRGHTGGD